MNEPPLDSPGDHHPPAKPTETPAHNDQDASSKLAQHIQTGERWLIALGFATLIINTVVAYVYWGQLKEMRAAVEITEQQVEMADRPWIKITNVTPASDLHFSFDKPIASQKLTVVAKNIGHTVALNVFVQAVMTFTENPGVLQKEQDAVCFSTKRTQPGLELTLFPDDESGEAFAIFGAEDGCVVYTIASSRKQHMTGFIYGLAQEISKKDSPFGFIYHPDFFTVGTDVPKEKLTVQHYALGITAN